MPHATDSIFPSSKVSQAVTRYFATVDRALSGATPDQKAALVETELRKWTRRYIEFQSFIDRGEELPGWCANATAYDFHETLIGLEARRPRQVAA